MAGLPSIPKKVHGGPKAFPNFQLLAKELRIKIWTEIAHLPRTIPLYVKPHGSLSLEHAWRLVSPNRLRAFSFITPVGPPAILQVNKEARDEALLYYKLSFGLTHVGDGMEIHFHDRIYVNWASDTILPLGYDFDHSAFSVFCEGYPVRHLALASGTFESRAETPLYFYRKDHFRYCRLETIKVYLTTTFNPCIGIEYEPVNIDRPVGREMTAREAHYGLVWTTDDLNARLSELEKEYSDRKKRNEEDKKKGRPGEEKSKDEIKRGPWKRPTVEITRMCQRPKIIEPYNGWYIGIDGSDILRGDF